MKTSCGLTQVVKAEESMIDKKRLVYLNFSVL